MLAAAEEATRKSFDVHGPHLLVGLIAGLVTVACVLVHYEAMSLTLRRLSRSRLPRRFRIVGLILAMLAAHVVEVWLFGLTYWFLDAWPALGHVAGPFDEGALDFVYFSVATFSTLGYGDFVATGPLTILCGTESLVGLSLIAWTASIAFLEMQRDWGDVARGDGGRAS